MKSKKKLSIIIIVVILIFLSITATFAFFKWNSSNSEVGFSISGLDAYIIYNKGTNILTGVLDPVSNYQDTAISTEITLYKKSDKNLYGHIYLDITTIGNNLQTEPALKWVITSNDEIINQGDFVGSKSGDSKELKLNIPLSETEQKFQIYIWLDENMDINQAIEGEPLSTLIKAEATEVEY